MSVEDRVQAGAEWLDQVYPDWIDVVDLDILDLMMPCECVLGQIVSYADPDARTAFGRSHDYYSFMDRDFDRPSLPASFNIDEKLSTQKAIDLGFHTHDTTEWDDLTQAWKELILERRYV